jgi:hypothetical protein
MSQLTDAAGRQYAEDDREPSGEERYAEALRRHTTGAKFVDIMDDLHECETEVMACIARKDFLTLGRIVWNVRAALARRAASREAFGSEVNEGPSAQQAAAMALYQETM